jgi:response regulator RpfG family c-di-GMP phosphodiesterase
MLAHHARSLRKHFHVHTALNGIEGLAALEQGGQYPAILADVTMPGMDGIEFLVRARRLSPDTAFVMLTGNVDQQTAVRALNELNVFRFLNKPCSVSEVVEAVTEGVARSKALQANRILEEKFLDGGIRVLLKVLHAADPHSAERSANLMAYVRSYYEMLDPAGSLPRDLEMAVTFCSIGFAAIPGSILRKARTGLELTVSEQKMMASAPELGGGILSFIPQMENAARIVRYQGKGFDGSGDPKDEVSGDALPFGSRLLLVMNDLLRLEAEGLSQSAALSKMGEYGEKYDPEILKVCRTRWRPTVHQNVERVRIAVPVEELSISDVLGRALYSVSNILLAPEGTIITKPLLRKIREWTRMQMLDEEVVILMTRVAHPDGLSDHA